MAGPPGLNLRGRRSRAVPVSASTPDIGRAARVLDAVGAALALEARRRRGGARAAVSLVSFPLLRVTFNVDLLLPAGARVRFVIAAFANEGRAPPLVRVGLPADAFGVHVRGRRQVVDGALAAREDCLLYTSPSPRDQRGSRMPSSA